MFPSVAGAVPKVCCVWVDKIISHTTHNVIQSSFNWPKKVTWDLIVTNIKTQMILPKPLVYTSVRFGSVATTWYMIWHYCCVKWVDPPGCPLFLPTTFGKSILCLEIKMFDYPSVVAVAQWSVMTCHTGMTQASVEVMVSRCKMCNLDNLRIHMKHLMACYGWCAIQHNALSNVHQYGTVWGLVKMIVENEKTICGFGGDKWHTEKDTTKLHKHHRTCCCTTMCATLCYTRCINNIPRCNYNGGLGGKRM